MLSYQDYVNQVRGQIVEVSVEDFRENAQCYDLVIDIRERDEVEKGTIPDTRWIPRGVLEARISDEIQTLITEQKLRSENEPTILLYCRSGARSALAAKSLQSMGLHNVASLAGGYVAWQKSPT